MKYYPDYNNGILCNKNKKKIICDNFQVKKASFANPINFGKFNPLCFYDNENPLTVLSESCVVNCLPICAP